MHRRKAIIYNIIWFILSGVGINILSEYLLSEESENHKILLWMGAISLGLVVTYLFRNRFYFHSFEKKLIKDWNTLQKLELENFEIDYVSSEDARVSPELLLAKADNFSIIFCQVENNKIAYELFERIETPVMEQFQLYHYQYQDIFPDVLPIRIELSPKLNLNDTLWAKLEEVLRGIHEDASLQFAADLLRKKERYILLLADAISLSHLQIGEWLKNNRHIPAWVFKIIINVSEGVMMRVELKPSTALITRVVRYPLVITEAEKLVKEKINYLSGAEDELNIIHHMEKLVLAFAKAELTNPSCNSFFPTDLALDTSNSWILQKLGSWINISDVSNIVNRYEWSADHKLEKDLLLAYGLNEIEQGDKSFLKALNNSTDYCYVRLIMDKKFERHVLSEFPKTEMQLIIENLPGVASGEIALSLTQIRQLVEQECFNALHKNDQITALKQLLKSGISDIAYPNLGSFSTEEKLLVIFSSDPPSHSFCRGLNEWLTDEELLVYFDEGNLIPNGIPDAYYSHENSCLARICLLLALAPYGPIPDEKIIGIIKEEIIKKTHHLDRVKKVSAKIFDKTRLDKRTELIASYLGELGVQWKQMADVPYRL